MRVGLTGGVASGKSTVARIFSELGAVVVDADVLAREVVAPGTSGHAAVVAAFGSGVLDADGDLDRPALAALVFGDEARRRELESIIHPRVRARAAELEAEAPAGTLVVHDIPLLVETGQADTFDAVVVVDVPPADQMDRMTGQRAMSAEDAAARIAAQATRGQRSAVATHLVDNTGSLARLRAEVEAVYDDLVAQSGDRT